MGNSEEEKFPSFRSIRAKLKNPIRERDSARYEFDLQSDSAKQLVKQLNLSEIKGDKIVIEELGLPLWVNDGTDNYISYIKEVRDDHVHIRSARASYEIYRNNKLNYYDPDNREFKATEEIVIEIGDNVESESSHMDSVQLVPSDSSKFEIREHPLRSEDGTMTKNGIIIERKYKMRKNGKDVGTLNIDYIQIEGHPLRHRVEARTDNKMPITLYFKWTKLTADTIEVTRTYDKNDKLTKKPQIEELGSDPVSISNNKQNIERVRIIKDEKTVMTEYLHASDKIPYGNQNMLKEIAATNREIVWKYSNGTDQLKLDYCSSTWWTDNPNRDGYVVSNSSNIYDGSPYKNMYAEYDAAGNIKRAFIEWPLSTGVRNAANILEVYFYYHGVTGDSANPVRIKRIHTNRPSTATNGALIYGEINTSAPINAVAPSPNPPYVIAGTNQVIKLDPSDLQNRKGNGWWAIGIKYDTEAPVRKVDVKTEEASLAATPKPKLYVVYQP
jgi:hypothetical protein